MRRNQNGVMSLSGIPQGLLLFIIYINYLETGINSDISKFANDTKIGRQIKNLDNARML